MRINTFQVGGILPVHTPWQYSNYVSEQSTTTSSSSSKSNTDPYEKMMIDVLKDMQGKVLPGEYDTFLKHVTRWLANPTQSKIPALLKLGNQMLHNADVLEKAKVELFKNNAAGEIARSGTRIYCMNHETENLELLTVEDIKKREKKNKPVQMLTYTDLYNLRANYSQLQFNNNIINDIAEGIGMDKVDKFCSDILARIKADTIEKKGVASKSDIKKALTKLASSFDGKAPTEAQVESFNQLLKVHEQMESSGDYDFHVKDVNSRKHMEVALGYIYQMMPKNMKEALTVQSQIYGDSNPIKTISAMLHFGTQHDETLEVKPDDGTKESSIKLGPLETFLNGDLNQTTVDITLGTDNVVRFKGSTGYLIDYKNDPLETGLLSNVFANNNMGAWLDKNQVYFGNQKIPQYALNNFICKAEQTVNTMVPVKSNGDIDFDMFDKLQKAESQIAAAPDKTPEVIQTIYRKNGVPTTRVGNEIKPNLKLEQFIIASGVTTDDVIEDPEDKRFMQLVKNDDVIEGYESMFESIYGSVNSALKKQKLVEIDVPDGDPIEGIIFMRVRPDALTNLAAKSGHGSIVTNPTLEQNMVRQEINNTRNNSNFTAANLAFLQ